MGAKRGDREPLPLRVGVLVLFPRVVRCPNSRRWKERGEGGRGSNPSSERGFRIPLPPPPFPSSTRLLVPRALGPPSPRRRPSPPPGRFPATPQPPPGHPERACEPADGIVGLGFDFWFLGKVQRENEHGLEPRFGSYWRRNTCPLGPWLCAYTQGTIQGLPMSQLDLSQLAQGSVGWGY